jgi:hypothetical protein
MRHRARRARSRAQRVSDKGFGEGPQTYLTRPSVHCVAHATEELREPAPLADYPDAGLRPPTADIQAAISARLCLESLSMIRSTWLSTVRSEITSRSPIW